MALFATKQFPAILMQTSEEMATTIPPGLPRSFAWLDLSSPCCRLLRRARHSTAHFAHAYARLSGLHWALPPLQSMSGNKMLGWRWSSPPKLKGNLSKYGNTSKFGDFIHGAVWQMGHNSRQYPFQTRVAFILPGWINSCAWHWLFPPVLKGTFGCQNNKKYLSFLWEVLRTYECNGT